jgi:hypothetical protein
MPTARASRTAAGTGTDLPVDWDPAEPLSGDLTASPVLWARRHVLHHAPDCSDEAMLVLYGDGRRSRRLRTWGHPDGEDPDFAVHYLSTRGGTNLHTDPGYPRFSYQLVLRNDGWMQRGLDRQVPFPLVPGVLSCLDTHSPHEVVPDPRMTSGRPIYKVALAVDRLEPIDPDEAFALLAPRLRDAVLPPCAPGRHTRF